MRQWYAGVGLCGVLLVFFAGCGPSPEQQKAAVEAKKPADVNLGNSEVPPDEEENKEPAPEAAQPAPPGKSSAAPSSEPLGTGKSPTALPENDSKAGAAARSQDEFTELKVVGFTFQVPGSWVKVQPASSIVAAEYQIPRLAGDEFDGRLTLTVASGDLQQNLERWKTEFSTGTLRDPKQEEIPLLGKTTTWIDYRGEWKGTSFKPVTPRKDYRMLAVIIPLDDRSSCFIKLTGPRATISENDDEFRAFVKSARSDAK